MSLETVCISDLSRNPRAVAEAAAHSGMVHDASARSLLTAMPDVFPWVRHLTDEEVRAFTVELVGALLDAAELSVDNAAQQVIEGWRATARITADPDEYREAKRPVEGDFGPVEIVQ